MPVSNLLLYVDAQYASPYAMSAFVSLSEKSLPFQIRTVDLDSGENLRDAYARSSITQRVPTLVHERFHLSESSAISEYLDEAFPDLGGRLYPADPERRARVRQVQAWLRSDLLPIRTERPTEVVFYGARGRNLSDDAQSAVEKLYAAADLLIPPDSEHLCGEWSIADADLALMLNRLLLHGDPMPERLATYARRQWSRPSVQLWVNRARPPL
jgi:glutathione S-transferase